VSVSCPHCYARGFSKIILHGLDLLHVQLLWPLASTWVLVALLSIVINSRLTRYLINANLVARHVLVFFSPPSALANAFVLLNSSRNYRLYYQVASRTDFTVAVQQSANDPCKDLIVVCFSCCMTDCCIFPTKFSQINLDSATTNLP
jgi:hypothetical protein